jgi:hypothetical protein
MRVHPLWFHEVAEAGTGAASELIATAGRRLEPTTVTPALASRAVMYGPGDAKGFSGGQPRRSAIAARTT